MITDEQIEQDLQHWARWAATRADAGLGWPSSTLEFKCMTEGPEAFAIKATPGPRVTDPDRHAELMDKAIQRLPDELRQAVVLRYITYRSNEACAGKMACSLALFKQKLRRAKDCIISWLDGRDAMHRELQRISVSESLLDHGM